MTAVYDLKNISLHYPTTGFSLTDISLRIEPESITAITGHNGSGKTSLLNILALLTTPQRGTLTYNDQQLTKNQINECRKHIGHVQQNPYLLRGSVTKNIELGLKLRHINKAIRQERTAAVLQQLNITALANRHTHTLSGGEAQKVALAQMLVLNPKVIILDEPFTHLDKDAIHGLETILLKLKKTIIFTTHNQYQAQWLAGTVYKLTKSGLLAPQRTNIFNGKLSNNTFTTDKLNITLPPDIKCAEYIAIAPRQIVLSKQKLPSSMQNNFQGIVTAIAVEAEQINVTVDVGEVFTAIITPKSMQELSIAIGSEIWINFKSSAIATF